MGTAVPVPAARRSFQREAPRPVPLRVTRALQYLKFSAKAPGDITNSPLPGEEITQEGLGKLVSVHHVKCRMLLGHSHEI